MVRQRIIETRFVSARELKRNPANFRTHPDDQRRDVTRLLDEVGQVIGLLARIDADGTLLLLDGHLRADIADDRIVRVEVTDLTEAEGRLVLALFDHTTGMAGINLAKGQQLLASLMAERPEWKPQLAGASKAMQAMARQQAQATPESSTVTVPLSQRFGMPPFSVLDTRRGEWMERRRQWQALGLDVTHAPDEAENVRTFGQDLMRGEHAPGVDDAGIVAAETDGSSSSCPVLAELMLRWFNVAGGMVLDPFAGPASIGVVAAWCGMPFTGVDLRQHQCDLNATVWNAILEHHRAEAMKRPRPVWMHGDASNLPPGLTGQYDFCYTSPPYFDLEKYRGGDRDGSGFGSYAEFLTWLQAVANHCARCLKENRFLVWKVSEIRGDDGAYRNFVADTIGCLKKAGLLYWNELVLVNSVGSLAIRVGRQFVANRKIGRTHQTLLVAFKGDPSAIGKTFPEAVPGCELGDL